MTSSQYAALNGTLGLELAVHLAFDQSLLIVGMSLDDAYLRDQILRFRSHIRNIYWFGAEDEAALKPEIRKWVWDTDIKRIKVQDNWLDFWEASEMRLERNGAPEPLNLLVAWHNIVLESMALLSKPKWSWLELLRQHSNLAVEAATEAALSALNSGENPNEADREDLATQEQIDAVLLPIRQEIERLANRPWRNIVTAAGNIELR